VERSGSGWRLRVDDIAGLSSLYARDLADVEPRARKIVWGFTGINPADIQLEVDIRLPTMVQMHLSMAEQLCEEATAELEAAIGELLHAGVSLPDIDRILRRRGQEPTLPMTVTNEEIFEHGLARHPLAIGIQWDDHGQFLTCTCRKCVEKMRAAYLDLNPTDENVLVYEQPFTCDYCDPKQERSPTPGRPLSSTYAA